MPDATSPDSVAPDQGIQASRAPAEPRTTVQVETTETTETTEATEATVRAEALAARVRAMDAEVRAIEAEALALAAETDGRPADGGQAAGNAGSAATAESAGAGEPDAAATSGPAAESAGIGSDPVAPAAAGTSAEPASDQGVVGSDGVHRREFVRRVTSDAVVVAGKFYSLSRVITRSATAAGQAVIADLESIRRDQEPEGEPGAESLGSDAEAAPDDVAPALDESTVALVGVPASVVATLAPPEPATAPAPPPPPPVPLNLTPDQESLLARVRMATLGVNRAGLSPHLTPAQFHWDGLVIRIPSLGWASRTTNVRREPHATLFVEDPETGEFGAISGMTTIVERRSSVREQNDGLLRRYYPDVDAEEQWTKLLAEDPDRVLLVLQPAQTIWGRRV